eukprot:TRINITY_DN15324_c0_g1_i2.p1 TRINITY_DN15324_c0_g1~~TRINITY_DN15324_c0_g1_i2.p1  ORF type:complete len:135 (-),score=15.06 TRINITY_DN15324_c0_g1_i2:68-472(-)
MIPSRVIVQFRLCNVIFSICISFPSPLHTNILRCFNSDGDTTSHRTTLQYLQMSRSKHIFDNDDIHVFWNIILHKLFDLIGKIVRVLSDFDVIKFSELSSELFFVSPVLCKIGEQLYNLKSRVHSLSLLQTLPS